MGLYGTHCRVLAAVCRTDFHRNGQPQNPALEEMMKKFSAYAHICTLLICVGFGVKWCLDGEALDAMYWATLVMLVALLPGSWKLLEEARAERAE